MQMHRLVSESEQAASSCISTSRCIISGVPNNYTSINCTSSALAGTDQAVASSTTTGCWVCNASESEFTQFVARAWQFFLCVCVCADSGLQGSDYWKHHHGTRSGYLRSGCLLWYGHQYRHMGIMGPMLQ